MKAADLHEIERKKERFREFLKVMGQGDKKNQSWNDNFEAFMEQPPTQNKPAEQTDKSEEPKGEVKEGDAKEGDEVKQESEFIDNKRLYLMNLSYQVTKEELTEVFAKFGAITDIEIPFRKKGKGVPLGIGFLTFETSESAISAFAEMDKTFFQGRKLHIKPAEKKPPAEEKPEYKPWEKDENMEGGQKSEYKQQKEKILKTNFDDETNWNYLFMNQDSVAAFMAK